MRFFIGFILLLISFIIGTYIGMTFDTFIKGLFNNSVQELKVNVNPIETIDEDLGTIAMKYNNETGKMEAVIFETTNKGE
jgi:hypothetical protein|tara:strand:- start:1433 stop:1672 length:240 start_codon:yes stop_codon:yes gene_type:complete